VIDVLSETHDPRAVDALIVLLNDSEGEHYTGAIEALGKTGNPQVLGPLLRELRRTKVGWDDFYIRVALAACRREQAEGVLG
jgi:HEAT repeat protein